MDNLNYILPTVSNEMAFLFSFSFSFLVGKEGF
jgi:hypothetical protein